MAVIDPNDDGASPHMEGPTITWQGVEARIKDLLAAGVKERACGETSTLTHPQQSLAEHRLITAFLHQQAPGMPAPLSAPSSSQPHPQPPPSPPNIRNAFDPRPLHGSDLAAARLESAAVTGEGRRLWVGTSDGLLQAYDIDPTTGTTTLSFSSSPSPSSSSSRSTSFKAPITQLRAIPAWGVLMGVVDGSCLTAFHLDTGLPLSTLNVNDATTTAAAATAAATASTFTIRRVSTSTSSSSSSSSSFSSSSSSSSSCQLFAVQSETRQLCALVAPAAATGAAAGAGVGLGSGGSFKGGVGGSSNTGSGSSNSGQGLKLLVMIWDGGNEGAGSLQVRREVGLLGCEGIPRAMVMTTEACFLAWSKGCGAISLYGGGGREGGREGGRATGPVVTSTVSTVYEPESEHLLSALVVLPPLPPPSPAPPRLLLSDGSRGVCFQLTPSSVAASSSSSSTSSPFDDDDSPHHYHDRRAFHPPSFPASASSASNHLALLPCLPHDKLTWHAPPKASQVVLPFLVSLLVQSEEQGGREGGREGGVWVEIHDLSSLAALQLIPLMVGGGREGGRGGGMGAELCACRMALGRAENVYVSFPPSFLPPSAAASSSFLFRRREGGREGGGEGGRVVCLTMLPLVTQIDRLVGLGQHRQALTLAALVEGEGRGEGGEWLAEIDLPRVREGFAGVLCGKGQYGEAVREWLQADTPPAIVLAHFSSLFPPDLALPPSLKSLVGKKKKSQPSARAGGSADAIPAAHVPKASVALLAFLQHHRRSFKEMADKHHAGGGEREGGKEGGVEEEVRGMAVFVDTMIVLSAARGGKKEEAVALLAGGANRADVDACAPVLAAQGAPFIEALLWLYRSHDLHAQALSLLHEDRCVAREGGREGGRGWTLSQFHAWTADYLSSLWHAAPPSPPSSPPPSSLVLAHLRPLLEGNPKLGLGVLVGGEGGKEGEKGGREGGREGGKGVSPQEVLAILKESKPRVVEADWKAAMRKGEREGGGEGGRGSLFYKSAGSTVALPLVTGATLAMAYLDYLIDAGQAPPALHDEYFLLLLTALLSEQGEEEGGEEEGEKKKEPLTPLGLLYQAKLREFLRSPSSLYHPQRLLPALQPFLPRAFLVEHALLLARLGQHRDVLRTYAVELNNPSLAEEYCEEVYRRKGGREGGSGGGRGEVYLDLVRVYLQQEEEDKKEGGREGGKEANTPRWLACLERNFDKIDAVAALSLLPARTTTLRSLSPYLTRVLRHCATERRHKEIVHQLLRVEELKVKQELILEQSRRVTITEDTACRVPTCRRPIGNTAILCYPNGVVVHLACGRNDLHRCPVTGEVFTTPGEER